MTVPIFETFVVKNLFEKVKTPSFKMKANDFPTEPTTEYSVPLLTAGIANQGLARFARPSQCPRLLSNVISVSANGENTGTCFYQPYDFAVLQDAYAIQPRNGSFELSENIGLYLVACLNRSTRLGRDWSNKAGWSYVQNDTIRLPVCIDDNGQPLIDKESRFHKSGYIPNWEYMDNYVRMMKQDYLQSLESLVQLMQVA